MYRIFKTTDVLLFVFALTVLTTSSARSADSGSHSHRTHLDNSVSALAVAPAELAALETKLTRFERESGIRILIRFHGKSPSEAEDEVPGDYMRVLSRKLGTIERGVLVVYFLDEPDWRMWLADPLTPQFTGKSGTAKELTASGAIHDAKEAFFAEVTAKADAAFKAAMKNADVKEFPANHPKRIALHAGATVDGLIAKLGTK